MANVENITSVPQRITFYMANVENITSVPQRIFKQSECQTAKTGHNIQVDNIQSQLLLYPFYTTNAY